MVILRTFRRAALLATLPALACLAADPATTAPAAGKPGVPLTWSSRFTDSTPTGNVRFHGPFGTETLTVSTGELPAHQWLDISIDLLILRTWDGSPDWKIPHKDQEGGPDGFRVALEDGRTLLYTTFSNTPNDPNFQPETLVQAFPSQVPGEHVAPQTGAAAKNSLGYNNPWPGKPQAYPMDATYHLHFRVPHDGPRATVDMSGLNLQNLIDESWGIVDVRIVPLAAGDVPHPSAGQINDSFNDSLDPASTNQQDDFQTLVAGMDDTVAWIEQHVKPVTIDMKEAQEQLANMGAGDEKMPEREAADQALIEMGHQVEPMLRDARQKAGGELRLRIDWVLLTLEAKPITTDELRAAMLATRALEVIGTPRALELRKKLVQS